MNWEVIYWDEQHGSSSLESWFESLTAAQFKSVAKELKLLSLCGNTLRLPHSKALGEGLFELREQTYGYRLYYGFLPNKIIVLLHAGDKSKQTRDIAIAKFRLSAFKKTKEVSYEN